MEDIEHYSIPVYNFPYDVEEDDEDTIEDNSELRVSKGLVFACPTRPGADLPPTWQSLLPFAIVGSEKKFTINGESVRGRAYPWGVVEVENPQHSDFARLRQALLMTHLTDLKEITHDFL